LISWNIGEINFSQATFLVGEPGQIIVMDPDMNLNPDVVDQVNVEISSDSDIAGITVAAIETNQDSGLFKASISFTQSRVSSGNRIFALPGDAIYGKYEDNTLPSPYSIQADLAIKTESRLESDVPPIQRISLEDIFVADSFGVPILEPKINQQLKIVSMIRNNQNYFQSFAYIIQVKDQDGTVVSLSWIQGELTSDQSLELSQSWTPTVTGSYIIESFVWNSLKDPTSLSPKSSLSYIIQ